MRMPPAHSHAIACLAFALAFGVGVGVDAATQAQTAAPSSQSLPEGQRLGLGSTPPEELIQAWNIDVSPADDNLPEGSGSVAMGREIYAQRCVACHGDTGQGGPMDRLVGGQGSLATAKPIKTVGSYWPYATTLYDYIRRAMPLDSPQSLQPDQVYAVSAYLLNMNGIVPDDAVLDKNTLPQVKMPNSGGFDQTDTITKAASEACMTACQPLAVEMKGATPTEITKEQVQ